MKYLAPSPTPARLPLGAVLTAVAMACAAGTAGAQTTRPAAAADSRAASVTSGDRKFIEDSARDGLAEVEMGKVVQQRATDARVKAFAQTMVRDHTKANAELAQLAAARGVALPTAPADEQRRYADALGKMPGVDVDRAYMKRMVDEHEKDVSDFRRFVGATQDAGLKAFATKTLATLETHLGAANTTHQSVDRSGHGQAGHSAVVLPAASAASR